MKISIEGIPNSIYSQGMQKNRWFEEAFRIFHCGYEDCQSVKTLEKFYKDTFALCIDLRTINDDFVYGDGKKLVNTQSGILLEIKKKEITANVKCHIFVLSDGLLNIVNRDLSSIQLKKNQLYNKMSEKITTIKHKNPNVNKLELQNISNKAKKNKKRNTKKKIKPFNMIIVGMTACGKTKYLLDFLEKEYFNCFDYIFLICPTFEWNTTYEEWKYYSDEDFLSISCDQDEVEKWLKFIVNYAKGTQSLIILDDCASGKSVKNGTSELVKLGFSGRHYNFSVVVITQQLTSIAKPFRENISKLVTFYNPNKKDMKTIMEEYLGRITKEEEKEIIKMLKEKQYSNLEINLIFPFDYKINEC